MRVCLWLSSAGVQALAVCLATAVSAAEPEAGPPVAEPAASEAPASQQPARDDYYTRRARSVLEAERAMAVKPHPLAARYPGMDVVVCEAGCPGRKGPTVVFSRPQAVRAEPAPAGVTEQRQGRMLPTAGTRDATATDPVCVAGCYDRTASAYEPQEEEPAEPWYPSTPPAPPPPRDALSPIR